MKIIRAVLSAIVIAAPAHAQSGEVVGFSPGDVVRISVWRQPELSGEFYIMSDGTIVHPLYRGVKVTGIPFTDVEARIRALLAQYEATPQFVIEPLLRIAVGGEVGNPNLYTVPPETTIAQAVALAGGPTQAAKLGSVRLLRGGRELSVDLRQPHTGAAASPVRSGDQIYIDRTGSFIRDVLVPLSAVTAAVASIISIAR
jgi:polysaccharide export outer membrane protein